MDDRKRSLPLHGPCGQIGSDTVPIAADVRPPTDLNDKPVVPNPDQVERLKRFPAKACPGLDPGWVPVRARKTRQIKNREPRFDSIETEKALAAEPPRESAQIVFCGTEQQVREGFAIALRAMGIGTDFLPGTLCPPTIGPNREDN
jgi:hypothetical protein